jgi:hypothetical protein
LISALVYPLDEEEVQASRERKRERDLNISRDNMLTYSRKLPATARKAHLPVYFDPHSVSHDFYHSSDHINMYKNSCDVFALEKPAAENARYSSQ